SLGMGVKSHSSSIEDAQADRARRKADREGLRRPVQPEEPAAAKKAPAAAKAAKEPTEAPAPEADGSGGPDRAPTRATRTSRPAAEQDDAAAGPAVPPPV